jgi:hypothetical protein
MKLISKIYPNWIKCNSCRWTVSTLYSFENEDVTKNGLCSRCFMDMLVEEEYEVKFKRVKFT